MKITVTGTAQDLPDLLGVDFRILDNAKSGSVARVSVQNTSAEDILMENGRAATVDGGYKVPAGKEVEFYIANLSKLSFISAGTSVDIRIITT